MRIERIERPLVRGILNAMNVATIRKLAGLISLLAGVAALPGRTTPAAVPADTAQNPVLWRMSQTFR